MGIVFSHPHHHHLSYWSNIGFTYAKEDRKRVISSQEGRTVRGKKGFKNKKRVFSEVLFTVAMRRQSLSFHLTSPVLEFREDFD